VIKFFRHIRQRLIKENRVSKYLIYAAGEIVLVVVGILIALQINNWNEDRKARLDEELYLNRLISENHQDIKTFNDQINFLQKGVASVELFSDALKDDQASDSSVVFAAYHYNTYGSILPVFNSSRSTFDDLSSTGNLQVISNKDLRELLVRHYAQIEQTKERLQINNHWALAMDGPFQVENNIMQYESSTARFFPERDMNEMAEELRKRKVKYINNAVVHYWINLDAISELEKRKVKADSLIAVLKRELNTGI
jgi:hypothetical protein